MLARSTDPGHDAPTSPVANLVEGPIHLLIGSQQSIRAIQLF
ncbi:hypothetical protein [Blastomonas marina]|jgi:hypothetical protein|nr:hypothetical protein [Blastomonas marina]